MAQPTTTAPTTHPTTAPTSQPAASQPSVPANLSEYAKQIVGDDLYKQVAAAATKANKPEILADFAVSVTAKAMGHKYIADEAKKLVNEELKAANIDPALSDTMNKAINGTASKPQDAVNKSAGYLEMDKETAQYVTARVNAKAAPGVNAGNLNNLKNDAVTRFNLDVGDMGATAVKDVKSAQHHLVESGATGKAAQTDLASKNTNKVITEVRENYKIDPKLADLAEAMKQMGISAPATQPTTAPTPPSTTPPKPTEHDVKPPEVPRRTGRY